MVFLPGVKGGDLGLYHAFVRKGLCRLALETGARPHPEDGVRGGDPAPRPPHPCVRSAPRRPRKTPGPRRDMVCVCIQQGCWEGGRNHGLWKTNRDATGL